MLSWANGDLVTWILRTVVPTRHIGWVPGQRRQRAPLHTSRVRHGVVPARSVGRVGIEPTTQGVPILGSTEVDTWSGHLPHRACLRRSFGTTMMNPTAATVSSRRSHEMVIRVSRGGRGVRHGGRSAPIASPSPLTHDRCTRVTPSADCMRERGRRTDDRPTRSSGGGDDQPAARGAAGDGDVRPRGRHIDHERVDHRRRPATGPSRWRCSSRCSPACLGFLNSFRMVRLTGLQAVGSCRRAAGRLTATDRPHDDAGGLMHARR